MTRHTLIKTIWVLFAALFLSVQGISQAHAVSNGGLDHSHDGITCDVALVAAEQVVLTPPLPISNPVVPTETPLWQPRLDRVSPRTFDGRAPPPRGPPLL